MPKPPLLRGGFRVILELTSGATALVGLCPFPFFLAFEAASGCLPGAWSPVLGLRAAELAVARAVGAVAG